MMYLLGMTEDNNIAYAEPELDKNGIFTCSFDTGIPFVPDDDVLEERVQEYFDEMDAESKINICERLHCAPQDVGKEWVRYDPDDAFDLAYDTSIYPNTITCDDGNEWYFESSSCGQHDVRKDGIKNLVVSKECFDTLMYLWDHYHLEKLPESEKGKYNSVMRELEEVNEDEEALIRDMIDENIIK